MSVKITKDGLKYFEWDSELREYTGRQVGSFIGQLRDACTIDEGVTLGDIFNAVEKDLPLCSFIQLYSSCPIDAFHQEAKKPVVDGEPSDLSYLGIEKHFEMDEYGASQAIHFSGVGSPEEMTGNDHYAIEFTPVNELVHLPVILKQEMHILKDYEKIYTAKNVCFTLLEVLDAIYDEISFLGHPEDRDKKGSELFKMVQEVKDGTAQATPFEIQNDSPIVDS